LDRVTVLAAGEAPPVTATNSREDADRARAGASGVGATVKVTEAWVLPPEELDTGTVAV